MALLSTGHMVSALVTSYWSHGLSTGHMVSALVTSYWSHGLSTGHMVSALVTSYWSHGLSTGHMVSALVTWSHQHSQAMCCGGEVEMVIGRVYSYTAQCASVLGVGVIGKTDLLCILHACRWMSGVIQNPGQATIQTTIPFQSLSAY